jgi:hypothetical protein
MEFFQKLTSDFQELSPRRKRMYLLSGLIVLCLLLLILSFSGKKNPALPMGTNGSSNLTNFPKPTIVVKESILMPTRYLEKTSETKKYDPKQEIAVIVGDEVIYNNEIQNYPSSVKIHTPETARIISNKLVEDSIILQEGIKLNIITADNSFYGGTQIDYNKRDEMVNKVKEEVVKKAGKMEGDVISIWFVNDKPGSAGIEQGKKLAFEKISDIARKVVSGQISMVEAAELIKNDKSLAQVDPSYKTNAIFHFQKYKGEQITFDNDFNTIIWNLNPGETSGVVLVKDTNFTTGEKYDAVYMFGQVTNKVNPDGGPGFDSWLNEVSKQYEAKYN